MKSQKRKTPGKKETKHKPAQVKETAQQNQPLDPVLLGEYHRVASQGSKTSQAAFSLRLTSPQAWNEWESAVCHQYEVYKKYISRLYPHQTITEEAARYDWDFRRDVELLRGGDPTKIEVAVAFLEADPWFHGSGYDKVRLVRYIKPPMLTPCYVGRLQNVVLRMVERRNGQEFRAYCRLARKVDGPELREGLTRRLDNDDADIRRRVLEALAQKDRMEQGGKAKGQRNHGE